MGEIDNYVNLLFEQYKQESFFFELNDRGISMLDI